MPSLTNLIPDVERAMIRGMAEGQKSILARAIRQSSGPYSLADFARLDHPFATRHGSPRMDPSTIHVQSGEFRRDWAAPPLIISGGTIHLRVENRNKVADFLKYGTRTMLPRPIEEAVEADAERLILVHLEREIERVLSQTYT